MGIIRIKQNDVVMVLTGRDRGKSGLVLEVSSKHNKIKVQGVSLVVRHYRARKRGESSYIKRMESFINASNVMLVDKVTNRPCRINARIVDGVKKRVSNVTKEVI